MNNIGIFNETNEKIEIIDTLKKVLNYAIDKEKLKNIEFNVIFVNREYIHNLNKTYRNKDRETDVITFALEDDQTVKNGSDSKVLGDIYICVEKAIDQAEEYGHSLTRELIFLAVHGFYHLLGYDHMTEEEEKVMFTKQEEVLNECGIKR